MGVRKGSLTGICPRLEIGIKKQIFLSKPEVGILIPINWFDSCNIFSGMKLTLHKSQIHSYSVMQWWAWRNHFESGGKQVHVKKLWKILWFELKTVTSQALKMTSLNFVRVFKQFYATFYKPSTTPIDTTPTLHWLEHINVTNCYQPYTKFLRKLAHKHKTCTKLKQRPHPHVTLSDRGERDFQNGDGVNIVI